VGLSDLTAAVVEKCVRAVDEGASIETFRAIVADCVEDPEEVAGFVTVPLRPDENLILFHSATLTITQSLFPAGFQSGLHNHGMPAVIGMWSGYEDNYLYRRSGAQLVEDSVVRVEAGEVLTLDRDVVHDVHAPPDRFSGAIHVVLGDLFGAKRFEWADAASAPTPFDVAGFAERWDRAAKATGMRT
jgi:predicted metal-dependent enzyme (double-stranded beta helix superfamily)